MTTALPVMTAALRLLDLFLIWFYRITGNALADFFIGTLILALLAIILGEISVSLALLALRKQLHQETGKAARYQDLSWEAMRAMDKKAYKAANQLANSAFGKCFFTQMALSAGFLWPGFLALAWLQLRFFELEYPLPGTRLSLGFIGVFILLYIPTYFLFKKARRKFPYFRRIKTILES